jgi:peptide/nickel transport system permease protein
VLTYIGRRLLIALPILVGVSIVTFLFANLAPGDPLSTLYRPDSGARPADLAALRESLGLDKPLHERYLAWIGQVVQGNLGYSVINHRSVADTLLHYIPNTLVLTVTALTIAVIGGVLFGIAAAYRQHSVVDRLLSVVVFLGISIPSYLLALLVIFLFAVVLKVAPASGMESATGSDVELLDRLHHLILPALVLAFGSAAVYMRYTRSSVLEVVRLDYVTTARSKGLGERAIRFSHVLRNALLPIVTIVGLSLPYLFTGALFIETMFSWPGIAKVAVDASLERDYPMIMGVALVTATTIVLSNLLADITYAYVDPRIRYS